MTEPKFKIEYDRLDKVHRCFVFEDNAWKPLGTREYKNRGDCRLVLQDLIKQYNDSHPEFFDKNGVRI